VNRILIIDDDPASCEMISDCLRHEGLEVISIRDWKDGLKRVLAQETVCDLILLDAVLPGMSAFDLLRTIRSTQDTPVIMLTVENRKSLHIAGLEAGADDFLVTPLDSRELIAKIRAILRRTKNHLRTEINHSPGRIALGDVELDAGTRVVRRNGEQLQLTSAEFSFLEILIRAAGRVVSREQLALLVFGRELGAFDRSLDMLVSRLRKKLGHKYNGIERIKTIRGVGFLYTVELSSREH
jgi:two-component system, OmpR family, response regulator CpxR